MESENLKCKFCRIIKNEKEKLLYEDEEVVLLTDVKPRAFIHLQAIPKIHIKNCDCLNKEHIDLLQHMQKVVWDYFFLNYPHLQLEKLMYIFNHKFFFFRLGFHKPPFYSIAHLHMHCLFPPFQSEKIEKVSFGLRFKSFQDVLDKLNSKK